tara:strand:- start:6406 stop:7029 length:624 start_codon:yes stop_codon:yes gene_type:complete
MGKVDLCGVAEDDYLAAALALAPEGPAWPREDGTLPPKFWRGVVRSLLRLHRRACDLQRESLACFADETLESWERVYGLPDPCDPGGATRTREERRLALCARETVLGGQSEAYFYEVAAALGYEITIKRYHEATCGLSYCGSDDQCGNDEVHLWWTVHVPGPRVTYATCGSSECGDYMAAIATAEDLECRLNALKPAFSELIFSYEG